MRGKAGTAPRYGRCFLCGKALQKSKKMADTRDHQIVWVGPDCYRKILAAGDAGVPNGQGSGGLRLYPTRQVSNHEADAYIRRLLAAECPDDDA